MIHHAHASYDAIRTDINEGNTESVLLLPVESQEEEDVFRSVESQKSSNGYHPRNETIRDEYRKNHSSYLKHVSLQMVGLTLLSSIVFSMGFLAGSNTGEVTPSPLMMQTEALSQQDQSDQSVLDALMEDIHKFFQGLPGGDAGSSSNTNHASLTLGLGGSRPTRPLIYLNRPNAYSLLMDDYTLSPSLVSISPYSTDFFLLSAGLDVQINQAYCAVATSAAIINSLRFLTTTQGNDHVNIPIGKVYRPYPYATQVDVFNSCTQANVISHTGGGRGSDGILTPPFGLSMAQVTQLLKCHLNVPTDTIWDSTPKKSSVIDPSTRRRKMTQETEASLPLGAPQISWSVKTTHVDRTHLTLGKVRYDIKTALLDPNSHILVNYDRDEVDQVGGGHWSPVGSYSEKEDAFLVLDVAKYKYTAAWIPSERLFDAMATWDECAVWDFPLGQDKLTEEERHTQDPAVFAQVMNTLGCERQLRGYIIVTRT